MCHWRLDKSAQETRVGRCEIGHAGEEARQLGGFVHNGNTDRQKARGTGQQTLKINRDRVTEMTNHVPKTAGHDSEIIVHAVPTYAAAPRR